MVKLSLKKTSIKGVPPQRINKLHQSYMSLQFPLLFVFGEPGFYPDLTLKPQNGKGKGKKVIMNAYYKYRLHPRIKEFGLIFRGGRLFQQYVVVVFCAIELSRLDLIRKKQNDLRLDYLSGLYDAISRGDHEGITAGSKIMLPNTYTRGPRYTYSHYLDALAICRSLGNPQFLSLSPVDSKGQLQDAERIYEFISTEIPYPVEDPRGYKLGESQLDNCNVIPYKRALCLAFEDHINVEYRGWSMLIKYPFKYISKGPDRILTKINDLEASASIPGNSKQIDEIQNYDDGRFICPYEACWRIFDFPIHYREPDVQILSVH
ncbi:DNA helicase [Tanacetum coccineum]|uniref:DNA helicase n=1 Tax=Tanacetum coccineum TaxID=301880 RepID=A0ABQ4YRJ2_9ASTR